jgi:hypothetical protein
VLIRIEKEQSCHESTYSGALAQARFVLTGETREAKVSIAGEGSETEIAPVKARLLLICAFVVTVFRAGEAAFREPLRPVSIMSAPSKHQLEGRTVALACWMAKKAASVTEVVNFMVVKKETQSTGTKKMGVQADYRIPETII